MHTEEQRKDESRKQQKRKNKVGLFTKWNIFKNGGFWNNTFFFIKR